MKYWSCILFISVFFVNGWTQSLVQEEQDYQFANQLAVKGMYDLAAVQFNRYADNYPMSLRAPEALFNAGMNYAKADSLNKAIQILTKLIFRYPDAKLIDQAQFNYAMFLNQAGEYQKAGLIWHRLYLFSPQSDLVPTAQLNAASAFLKIKDYTAAGEAVRLVMEKYPIHPLRFQAQYLLAKVLMGQRQYDAASQQLNRITVNEVDDELSVNVLLLRAQLMENTGRYVKADSILQVIVHSGLKSDSVFIAAYKAARSLSRKGDVQKSNDIIATALDLNPAAAYATPLHIQKTDNYFSNGQFNQAWQSISAIDDKQMKPDQYVLIEFRRGVIQKNLKNPVKALTHFQDVLKAETSAAFEKIRYYATLECSGLLCQLDRAFEGLQLLQDQHLQANDIEIKNEIAYNIGLIKENYLKDITGARYSYSAILSSGNNSLYADDAQICVARTFQKEQNDLSALSEYIRFQSIFPGADQAREVETRIQSIKKFRKVDPVQTNQILSDFLLQQASENTKRDMLAHWIKQQINVYHDYEQALQLLKTGYSQKEADLFPEDELLYYIATCHAFLTEKYINDLDNSKAGISMETLSKTLSLLKNNYPTSAYLAPVQFLETRVRLLTASGFDKILLVEQALNEIAPGAESDSLRNQLKMQLAEVYFIDAATATDSTLHMLNSTVRSILNGPCDESLKARALYMQGSLLRIADVPDSAATIFQQLVTSYPKCYDIVRAIYSLGEIYEQLGLYDQARILYDKIVNQYYYSSLARPAQDKLWSLAIQSGQAGSVIAQIDIERNKELPSVLELYLPTHKTGEMLWFYANAQLKEKHNLEALNALKNYLSGNPTGHYRAQALFMAGEVANEMNNLDVALGYFSEVIASFPEDSLADRAQVRCADLYFERNLYDRALVFYRSIQKNDIGAAVKSALGKEIVCLYKLQQIDKATRRKEEFLKQFPDDVGWEPQFFYEEGMVYLALKDFKAAENSFRNLIKKYQDKPQGARGELGLARMYVILNNSDEALKILIKIPEKYTDPEIVAMAYLNLGDFYYENRQIENTITACSKVLDLQEKGPVRARAMDILINAYDDYGIRDRALTLEREYVRQYPNDPTLLDRRIRIGIFLYNLKEYDRAISALRDVKLLVSADDEARVQYWIAKCYADDGNREQAIIEFLKVKYLSKPTKLPFGPTALYEAALEFRKLRNFSKAIELLREVVTERGLGDSIGQAANIKIQEIEDEIKAGQQ